MPRTTKYFAMNINKYFDHVYVLNLDRNKDRMKRMEKRLASVGIKAHRWSAVDGNKLKQEFKNYQLFPLNMYEEMVLGRKAIVSTGAMGCLYSYIEIIKDAKDKGYKRILCLEDDAIFHKKFKYRWSQYSKELPEDWKLLYLGASQLNWRKVKSFNKHFYHAQQTDGTFAFAIDHSVFDLYLQHASCHELPADTYLQTIIQKRYPKKCFVFNENLVIAELGKSDIREESMQYDILKWDVDKYDHRPGVLNVVMGVITYNRIDYLRKFLKTFEETRNVNYKWTVIIADDGSDDDQIIKGINIPHVEIITINNNRKGVAWQTNTILQELKKIDFDFAFMANDDIWFEKGWDDRYIDAAFESGHYHLVYHNTEWKKPTHEIGHKKHPIVSYINAKDCLGCFFTITPEILSKVGYFDYQTFGFRGGEHIDYTIRCCRAGFNEEKTLWDMADSQSYITMHQREDYVQTIEDDEMQKLLQPHVLQRKERAIRNDKRIYIEFNNSVEKIHTADRGIVLLALGDPYYGRLAFNMAMSIKAVDKYMPVALFYSEKSLEDLGSNHLELFDHLEELDEKYYRFNNVNQYQRAKTWVYNLSPYDTTIYFDADSLWNPFRQPEWLFDQLAPYDFAIDCNGFLNLRTETRTRPNYLYWVKNDNWPKIKRYYGVETGVIPQTSSTFFYFKRTKENDTLFRQIQTVYDKAAKDYLSPAVRWNSGIADEYAFNIGMMLENRLPHTIPFHPVYYSGRSGLLSKQEILLDFWCMTNGGVVTLPDIAEIYNEGVDYFADKMGISERFHHENKTGVIPGRLLT